MNLQGIVFTETEAELLMLAMIEVKELWEKSEPGKMSPQHHTQVAENYQSIIDKTQAEYDMRSGQPIAPAE